MYKFPELSPSRDPDPCLGSDQARRRRALTLKIVLPYYSFTTSHLILITPLLLPHTPFYFFATPSSLPP